MILLGVKNTFLKYFCVQKVRKLKVFLVVMQRYSKLLSYVSFKHLKKKNNARSLYSVQFRYMGPGCTTHKSPRAVKPNFKL